MADYELGNCLRGWCGGSFESDDEAWRVLSERFNNAFPSRSGRDVQLRKYVRSGQTAGGNETERDKALRERIERAIAEDNREHEPPPFGPGRMA